MHKPRLALICATLLAGTIILAIGWAIADPVWRNQLKDFQIALGGLGALAAALVAHDGHAAMAREARRKDDRDRKDLHRKLLVQSLVNTRNVTNYCIGAINNLQENMRKNFTVEQFRTSLLVFINNRPLDDAWSNISFFSEQTISAMSKVWNFSQAIDNAYIISKSFPASEPVIPQSVEGIIETLKSGKVSAEKLVEMLDNEIKNMNAQALS
jgi:hypothetical protein